MADNYLEKKAEELNHLRPKIVRTHPSLESLLKRNRSFRGYDAAVRLSRETLRDIASVASLVPSGMNAQRLRFRLVPSEEASLVLPHIRLGAALPEEHLPHPGEEPQGYIVISATGEEDRVVDMDLGIAAQSMLLRAVEKGLNGIFILNFRPEALQEALGLPLRPLAVLAFGKGIERIFLMPVKKDASLRYYRKDGVHYVPKLGIDDLLI